MRLIILWVAIAAVLLVFGGFVEEHEANQCEAAGGTPIRTIAGIYTECVPQRFQE